MQWLNCCFCSAAKSCPTLCDPVDSSTPGFPALHHLPELAQTQVHWVSDAIQPSHPLSSPSPLAFNLSQHQGFFQQVSSSHPVAKVLELQHQSFRVDFLLDWLVLAVQGTLKCLPQHHNSKASILQCSAFFKIQLLHLYLTTRKTIALTRQTFVSVVMSLLFNTLSKGSPDSSVAKESSCNAGDPGLIPGSGRSAREWMGYPLQYSWASFVAQLVKNLPAMLETWGSITGLGRSPGEGSGYPLQYSGWKNSLDCIIHGDTTERLSLSLVTDFLPRSKDLSISWLQSPSTVNFELKKINSVTVSLVSLSICHEVMGSDAMMLHFWMLSFKPAFSFCSFTFMKRLFGSSLLSAIRVVLSE